MTKARRVPPRAILFDLDGVIVDTMPSHFASWKTIAARLGVELTESELETFRGVRRELCLDRILERRAPVDSVTYDRLLRDKNESYREALSKIANDCVLPGSRAVLAALRSARIPVGLVSASRNAVTILEHTGLAGAFDVISDGHFTGRAKPAPDQIVHVAQQLGVEPEQTAVFEDAPSGLEAARAAGAQSVGIGLLVRDHRAADHWFRDLAASLYGPPLNALLLGGSTSMDRL